MKKLISITIILLYTNTHAAVGVCTESIIYAQDKLFMQELYKKIAYYAYLHKRKRDYIAKSYALIAEMRKIGMQTLGADSSTVSTIGNSPMLQVGVLESSIIAISNKVNLALLEHILYKDIKKEIHLKYKDSSTQTSSPKKGN